MTGMGNPMTWVDWDEMGRWVGQEREGRDRQMGRPGRGRVRQVGRPGRWQDRQVSNVGRPVMWAGH